MKSTSSAIRVAIVAGLAAVTAAPAGIRDKAYEVGVYAGIENGDQRTSVPSGGSFGIRAGYAFTKKIMAELTVDGFPASRQITERVGDPSLPIQQVPIETNPSATFVSYMLGLTANFLTERDVKTNPYFNVSLGFVNESRGSSDFTVRTNPNDPNSVISGTVLARKDTGTGLSVSAGARTFLRNNFGIRYEVRYIHHDTFAINQDGFQFSAGATFVLGGKK
ncbi:MAG TPA: outer membrane beta-barrel protein [Verrucomicrobiae bacterium]|nr:outer membrane beta-barrel protein [Verrucomicrobiae bacterium]